MSIITFCLSEIVPGTYMELVKGTMTKLSFESSNGILSKLSAESKNFPCAIFKV